MTAHSPPTPTRVVCLKVDEAYKEEQRRRKKAEGKFKRLLEDYYFKAGHEKTTFVLAIADLKRHSVRSHLMPATYFEFCDSILPNRRMTPLARKPAEIFLTSTCLNLAPGLLR